MTARNRTPGQQAAWDTYLAVTRKLLPILNDFPATDADAIANHRLGAVVIRIHRYAPMWGEHAPILIAAAGSAVRLYRHGDIPALRDLLQVLAHRLYQLSTGQTSRFKPRNQRHAGLPHTGPPHIFGRPPLPPPDTNKNNDISDEGTKGLSEE